VRGHARFECDEEQTCTQFFNRHSANGYKNGYYVDWGSHNSIHNWIEDFNLRCVNKFYLGVFASAFFLGQVCGTPALAALGDKEGRVYVLKRIISASLVF
jgi:hypothetical protein